MRTALALSLLLGAGLVAGGCVATSSPTSLDPALFSWPPGQPRLQLQKLISTRRDVGGKGLLARLAGDRKAPLFQRPYGVAWAGDDILVADPGAGTVLKLTADGKILRSPEGLLSGPIAVAACPEGIVVADSRAGSVALLDARLRLVRWLAQGLARPTGVVCTEDDVFVVETARHRLLRLTEGDLEVVAGGRGLEPGKFNFPAALTLDGDELWIGDTLNFRIQRLSTTGRPLGEFGQLGDAAGETPRVKGIAVDAAGHLWISDALLDQVALFTADGELLVSLGHSGSQPGEFSFPTGIAAHPDGRVVVADSMNRRLQVFTLIEDPTDRSTQGGRP